MISSLEDDSKDSMNTDQDSEVIKSETPAPTTCEELSSETSNTMTLEQFTDIVLASEGMTLNNNNSINDEEKEELEKKAMVATILQNKDLTVEVKTYKSKPVVLSPRENNAFNSRNSLIVSVKPRPQVNPSPTRYSSQNLVEEWLKKMPNLPPASSSETTTTSSTALNLSVKKASSTAQPQQQYSRNPGAFNQAIPTILQSSSSSSAIPTILQSSSSSSPTTSATTIKPISTALPKNDEFKSRALRDIQLAHTKDVHGN